MLASVGFRVIAACRAMGVEGMMLMQTSVDERHSMYQGYVNASRHKTETAIVAENADLTSPGGRSSR